MSPAKKELQLEPVDAFGDYDDRLLFLEPRHLFAGAGRRALKACPRAATLAPKDRLYFVSDIYPDHVVMDANHPFAGIALRIHLQVHAVREARSMKSDTGWVRVLNMQVGLDDENGTTPSFQRPTLH